MFKEDYIEIKKGKSIWLDEVRYCEILMSDTIDDPKCDGCKIETITIFIIPTKNKQYIEKIYVIETKNLIDAMKLTPEWAYSLLERKKQVKRSLNCQQSLTISDLKKIADYVIINENV